MSEQLSHEADAHRYVLRIDGQLVALVDYALRPDAISFHHTFTTPAYRGRGLAGRVVDFAVTDVEQTSARKIVPMCWCVSDWFAAHPERAHLLL